jgi:hypothetical protein
MNTKPIYALIEKVVLTYLEAFGALFVTSSTLGISTATAAAVAAIPAALTVVANGIPQVSGDLPFGVDLVFRTVRTYVVTFIGVLVAVPVFTLTVSSLRSAAIAAIPAALTVVKSVIARKIGADTAALLPASLDPHATELPVVSEVAEEAPQPFVEAPTPDAETQLLAQGVRSRLRK